VGSVIIKSFIMAITAECILCLGLWLKEVETNRVVRELEKYNINLEPQVSIPNEIELVRAELIRTLALDRDVQVSNSRTIRILNAMSSSSAILRFTSLEANLSGLIVTGVSTNREAVESWAEGLGGPHTNYDTSSIDIQYDKESRLESSMSRNLIDLAGKSVVFFVSFVLILSALHWSVLSIWNIEPRNNRIQRQIAAIEHTYSIIGRTPGLKIQLEEVKGSVGEMRAYIPRQVIADAEISNYLERFAKAGGLELKAVEVFEVIHDGPTSIKPVRIKLRLEFLTLITFLGDILESDRSIMVVEINLAALDAYGVLDAELLLAFSAVE